MKKVRGYRMYTHCLTHRQKDGETGGGWVASSRTDVSRVDVVDMFFSRTFLEGEREAAVALA